MVETRNSDHTEEVKNILTTNFRHVEFIGMSDHSTDTRKFKHVYRILVNQL